MAAAKSFYEAALAHIDAQIADLNRAREIIVLAANSQDGSVTLADLPKRGRPRKPRGLPVDSDGV